MSVIVRTGAETTPFLGDVWYTKGRGTDQLVDLYSIRTYRCK